MLPSAEIRAEAADKKPHISYIQTVFNSTNGLLCGHANAIAQTNDGVLWIGTYAGLYRYNGSEFVHMDGFTDVRNVNCLYVDEEGRLWIGTNDNGVVIVIGEKVANVFNTSNGLPSDSIRSIVQSASGDYYIGTTDGMVSLELKTGISIKSRFIDAGYVERLTADSLGHVAALNKEGRLYVLEGDKFVTGLEFSGGSSMISCCTYDSKDELLIGTTNGEYRKYFHDFGQLLLTNITDCEGLTKINNIYPGIDDEIWLCSDSGVGYIDSDGVFTKQKTGGFDHSIENMVCDYQGNLWFASSRLGLLRLMHSCIKDIYADAGLETSVVNTTAFYDGMLYAGTDDGLSIIDTSAGQAVSNKLTTWLAGRRIRCILPDSKGDLWFCTYGGGLLQMDRDEKLTSFSSKFPELGTRVRVCYELMDGSMAVSSAEGLFFFEGEKLTGSIPYSETSGYSQVLCLLETPDGTLYAGTDGNGIIVIKETGIVGRLGRDEGLTSDVILRMVRDEEDGSIYIVTSNSVCRYDGGEITPLDAVPYSNNYDIMIDGDEIFLSGSAGIYVLDKKSLLAGNAGNPLLLNSKLGMVGALTANAWNAVDENKNVYLSTDRGVLMMNLDDYTLDQRACRLTVSEMRLDDLPRSIERGSDISVGREVSKVEFVPEIINYTYADPTISYILEGFDTSWTNVKQSELLSISYTNLNPGKYNLRLAILGADGEILEESDYGFTKEKALYDNAWFKYYMVGVAAVFVGWLTWFITRTQLQHTLNLQQAKLALALQQVQMGNETILAIAKTVDAKDLRTSKHSQRVSEYSKMIAHEYGFSDADCENLRQAALLHDIGKIAIPDSVLNKPGRLTDEEYAVMKTHVTRGAEILKDFTLIDHVVEGARFHHERYDGRGYPDGLKGEEIPLYGRIIAIADAFDAMTANRVYRKRQDFDYVMGELHKGRGTQFDPDLLDIFLKLIDDKKIDIDALYSENAQKGEE